MSDPLSIAASIAGLLCLAGTASKSIFQFISSIADAPEQARHLTRELYALNVALGQVQGNILDPRFSIENDNDENVRMLHECLASCMAVYSELESRLRNAGLAKESSESRSIGIIQRSWKSFKWSFTDGELGELLRRVDAEKATLGLINNAFAAKLAAGILGSLKETEGQIRQMNRRLKNVQVVLEWMDRYENVISISENLENTRVVGRRNAMEEVLREYDEYLQRVFSKRVSAVSLNQT
ncbi:hypothetical protein BDD12DRAFT_299767 [Trichophaea hybrida]|nr:hypothetical protein BDD12DRAFT_299767 [Trichophaea hybrida]